MRIDTLLKTLLPGWPILWNKPTVPLKKVFGIGLPKTGTTTLGAALTLLGYRVRDYDRDMLLAVLDGDVEAALQRAENSDAFEDCPWWMLYRELDARFPQSLFILTERQGPEVWLRSGIKHLERTPCLENDLSASAFRQHFAKMGVDQPLEMYDCHSRAVREYFADRTSQFRVMNWENGDGWKELCGFLELPIPAEGPFPHENAAPINH
jgi:hypothetical protein